LILLAAWRASRDENARAQAEAEKFWHHCAAGDPAAVYRWFDKKLPALPWPHETTVDYNLSSDQSILMFDLEVATLEDMPDRMVAAQRGRLMLDVSQHSEAARRQFYLIYVYSTAFRLIGEAMAALPLVQTIVISLHTAMCDTASRHYGPGYIYSARISRHDWQNLDFATLGTLDLQETFAHLGNPRVKIRNHVLHPVEPFID
jgi:hypothetical protein